jgi:hypothetical protein
MNNRRPCTFSVLWTIVGLAALVSSFRSPSQAAFGPPNLARPVFDVNDFGADPSGTQSSLSAIRAALASCSGGEGVTNPGLAGCEIHFPAGKYSLIPGSGDPGLPIALPTNIPITISGDGQRVSTLLSVQTSTTPVPDAFFGSSASHLQNDGFVMHDIGFEHAAGSVTGATGGADIHLPKASEVSLYNLYFHGAYTPIELGVADGTGENSGYTNISAITSENTVGCFLALDGGNGATHVVGITADGGHNVSSQVLCLPSGDATSNSFGNSAQQKGTGTFRFSDSTFTAFGRGITVTGFALLFKNNYFDRIVIDSAEEGPAFEIFAAPTPLPTPTATGFGMPGTFAEDIRISNSRLVSAATACVVHGNVLDVKLVNDTCIGAQPAPVPSSSACIGPLPPSQRGYVIAEVAGMPSSGTITLSITYGGVTHTVSSVQSSMESREELASDLGMRINSMLVNAFSCPVIVPVAQFKNYLQDIPGQVNFSIGPDIELFSYQWGSGGPTISASSTGGATLTLLGVGPTFMPADAITIGTTGSASGPVAPADITVAGSAGFGATNGAGLHLQGGSALLIAGNAFGNQSMPNQYGIELDSGSGMSYAGVQVRANNLSHNSLGGFQFVPSVPLGASVTINDNVNFNPSGIEVGPSLSCGTPAVNPFPNNQQVYIVGAFMDVKKNGVVALQAGSTAVITLSVGDSFEIDCGSLPAVTWYGL